MRSHQAFLLLVAGQACTVDRTATRNLVAVDGIEPEEPGLSRSHVVCGLGPVDCATRYGGAHVVFGGAGATVVLDQPRIAGGPMWIDEPPPGATYSGPFTTAFIPSESFEEGGETEFVAEAMLFVSAQEFQPIPLSEGTLEVVSVGEARGLDDAGFSDVRLCWNLTFGEVSPDTTYAKYHGCQTFP